MNILGIRIVGINSFLGIYDSISKELITEEIVSPLILDTPERLKYLRFSLIDILRQYNIEYAGIKIIEYGTFNEKTKNRLFIEGVIQETFATSSLKKYYLHRKIFLNSCLGNKNLKIDDLIDNSDKFNFFMKDYIDNYKDMTNKDLREIALITICSYIKATK